MPLLCRCEAVSSKTIPFNGPLAALTADAHQRIWIASGHRLARWQESAFEDCTPTNGQVPGQIRQLIAAGDGSMWVVEPDRLRRWQDGQWRGEARQAEALLMNFVPPVHWHGDRQGGLWAVHEGTGLWHVKAGGETRLLTERDGLPSRLVTCWLQDRQDNVWVGTLDGGLARIRERLFRVCDTQDGLPGQAAQSVCEDAQGTLWAGTVQGGLARWESNRFVAVPLPAGSNGPIRHATVFPHSGGGAWVGSRLGGVWQWRDRQLTQPFAPTALSWDSVRVLYEDRAGRLWIGNGSDLYAWQNSRLIRWRDTEPRVGGMAIAAITEDARDNIWIGTGPGELWRFHAGQFACFRLPETKPPPAATGKPSAPPTTSAPPTPSGSSTASPANFSPV